MMGKFLSLLFCVLISNLAQFYAQNCSNYAFSNNAIYASCVSLPALNTHLHWNLHPNRTVNVAFRHTGSDSSQWVAWGLNTNGSGMVGTQALVAVTSSTGSVRAYTSSVTGYGTSLQPGDLSFVVESIRAQSVNGDVVIFATLVLPSERTSFNHTWQVGPVTSGAPAIHPMGDDNRGSLGTVDFTTGNPSGSPPATTTGNDCSNFAFTNNANYATCVSLPVLNTHLHWNLHPNRTVDVAFRHNGSDSSQWVAWGLNINGSGMVGTQALVAVTSSTGSVRAYTSSVTGYGTSLLPGNVSFGVERIRAQRVNGDVVIFATLVLPSGRTRFNQTWQVGPVTSGAPAIHPMGGDNRGSLGTVDFLTGNASGSSPAPTPTPTTTGNECSNFAFTNNANYATCVSLPVLNSHLHWNYNNNRTVAVAFRHAGSETSQWVAWALNIQGSGMVGAQALVAVTSANGSVRAYTSSVDAYGTSLQPSSLSFGVPMIRAERVGGDVVIYATIVLPNEGTTFNQVWQVGPANGGNPAIHPLGPDNRASAGTVNFLTGQVDGAGNVGGSRQRRRNTHGVLNAVSWGVLMPMGAMAARYLKVFKIANPAWFYIHAACQTSAYIVGVAGWATGLKLGGDSTGIRYNKHRNIGITLFAIGTLQVFALLLRPKPDHKYRLYWTIYHQTLGYSVIVLSIINVYEGLDILDPEKKWKDAYTGILIALGVMTVVWEALTWYIVLKRKQEDKRTHAGANGSSYAANGQSA